MTPDQLISLVGMALVDAVARVRAAGLKPQSLSHDAITTALTIPANVVRLRFGSDGKVVSAVTQAAIDARYN